MTTVVLSASTTLFMGLADNGEAGVDYDQIVFTGLIDLTGVSLEVSLLDGFTPAPQRQLQPVRFHRCQPDRGVRWHPAAGHHQRLVWDISELYSLGSMGVNAVPLPPAVWLFGSTILGLLGLGVAKPHNHTPALQSALAPCPKFDIL